MSKFPDLKNPIHFIATLGGIGKIPIAPGTWGSIFAFLVFIYISHYVDMFIVVILSIPFSIWICEKASVNLIEKEPRPPWVPLHVVTSRTWPWTTRTTPTRACASTRTP